MLTGPMPSWVEGCIGTALERDSGASFEGWRCKVVGSCVCGEYRQKDDRKSSLVPAYILTRVPCQLKIDLAAVLSVLLNRDPFYRSLMSYVSVAAAY